MKIEPNVLGAKTGIRIHNTASLYQIDIEWSICSSVAVPSEKV